MADYEVGVSAVRYPRDNVSALAEERFGTAPPFELGRARALVEQETPDVAILAYGTCGIQAIEALDQLQNEYKVSLYDARFAKPVDIDLIRTLVEAGVPIVTIEDHGIHGGFGANVVEACNLAGLDNARILRLGMPERWILQGSRNEQLEEIGIDPTSIARSIRTLLDTRHTGSSTASSNHVQQSEKALGSNQG
jgi:1-deoxy-D-xylulose-5-phosphate synthase